MNLKRDIVIYYIFSFLLGCYIADAVTVLFERALDFSYAQVFTINAVYMLMFVFFEVPSGAFADILGRKRSIMLGALLIAGATILTGISHTFWQVFGSYIVWAMGFSCISGAGEALLYDRIKDEKVYSNVYGRASLLTLLGMLLAGIVGPHLFEINFRLPYLLSAIPFFLSGVAIMFFHEHSTARVGNFSIKKHFHTMWQGARTAAGNKFIRWSTLVMAMTFAVMYTMANAYQPYLQNVGFSIRAFSVIVPAMFLIEGIGGFVSERLYEITGENRLFMIVLGVLGLSIGFMGLVPLTASVAALWLYSLMQGVGKPLMSVYANRHIESSQRATVLSVQAMISTIAAAMPLFVFGSLSDRIGLNRLFVILGGIIIVCSLLLMLRKPKTT